MARCPCSSVIRARCQAMLWNASRRSASAGRSAATSAAERREWWLANGRGGYAAGTIARQPDPAISRAADRAGRPAARPRLVWPRPMPSSSIGERRWPLFTNRWSSGTIEPGGSRPYRDAFVSTARIPVWRFAMGLIRVEHGSGSNRVPIRPMSPGGSAGGPDHGLRTPSLRVRAHRQRPRPPRRDDRRGSPRDAAGRGG